MTALEILTADYPHYRCSFCDSTGFSIARHTHNIERCEECRHFDSDEEAITYVNALALAALDSSDRDRLIEKASIIVRNAQPDPEE